MGHLSVKHTLLSVAVAVLLVGCPAERPSVELKRDPIDLLTGEALDADGRVPPRTNDQSTPSYALLPTERLWQEIVKSRNYAFVVVKSPKQARGFYQDKLLIGTAEAAEIKSDMLATINGLLEARGDGSEFQLPRSVTGMVFPGFFARVETLTALAELRARHDLDYVEPLYYEMMIQSGCGYEPYVPSTLPWLQDETKVGYSGSSTDVVPYTFRHLGITKAWKRFPQPGKGIMLAVLDTGMSRTQDQLQGRFALAPGGSRSGATHLDSTGSGLNDVCGHGTKVAGLLAAPNDGRNIVGALYAADLTTVKVGHSPVQDVFSGSGWVCDGIAKAVNAGAKVVNMSFGFLISSPTVEQCIRSAFDNTTVIFVASAGTGPQGGVIFPANMDREVIAVTSVDIDGPGTYHMIGGAQTTSVGYGQNVDFASVYSSNRMPSPGGIGTESYVGQAIENGFPPGVVGQPYTQFAAGGGTSSAAPTLSAVFGLTIQSQLTPTTRADIIAQVAGASTIVNVRNADGSQIASGYIGAGIPNAYVASGGSTKVDILASPGDTVSVGQAFTLTATQDGRSPLRFSWGSGGGGQTKNFTAPSAPGPYTVSLHVTDDMDPTFQLNLTKTMTVVSGPVPPPTLRLLSSADVVYMNQSFPTGGQADFRVNQGRSMPAGCVVIMREGRTQYAVGGVLTDRTDTFNVSSVSYGGLGFMVSKPAGVGLESLDTLVHLWHDQYNSVHVRVKYTVLQPAGVVCDVPGFTQP